MDDVVRHNRGVWDAQSAAGGQWSTPVSAETVARARAGDWSILLTPLKPVPAGWFPALAGLRVLALAGSGGQQAPVLAAAGAHVTVLDVSPQQLSRDREVAERDGLSLTLMDGDMQDLSAFPDGSFDLIVNPVSVCFAPDVRQVWREAFRVLRPGGRLMTGFPNPVLYLFDEAEEKRTRKLLARHRLPCTDRSSDGAGAISFSHSLEDLIGGQLAAGFRLIDLYEDEWSDAATLLNRHMKTFIATLAEAV